MKRAQPEVSDAPTSATLRGLRGRSRAHPWLLGQPESALGDDVALNLASPGVDGPGPAGQEDVLPAGSRIAVPLGTQQAVGALDAQRDLAKLLVILAPEQLGHGRFGTGLAALGQPGQGA